MNIKCKNVASLLVLSLSIPDFSCDFPLTEPATIEQLNTRLRLGRIAKRHLGNSFWMPLKNSNVK